MKWDGNQIILFLNIYEKYEILWNIKLKEHMNKLRRDNALEKLLKELEESGFQNIDITVLKTKIKTIKTVYRQEVNKILKSKKSGSGTDDLYKPKLMWFARADSFLRNMVISRETTNNMNAKVWIPHPEEIWESAKLLENYSPTKQSLNVEKESGETKSLVIKSEEDLPFLRNPHILLGENDLISLSYLHEPAVLHNLKYRFCKKNYIYTYCGIVMFAINPYTDVPIYDIEKMQQYRGKEIGNLDPHIFGVAEEAYRTLEREQRNQSIIVTGESGAGKTVSAKYIMRYFATVGGSTKETQVDKKVLASSPIMEAIGTAKTTRNDNSSRYGKFIELQFNKQFHISGASMRTYLLEKSRVVFQAPDERNYHIFYQICAARGQLEHLHLDHPDRFHYLNQGGSPNVPGVDDLKYFEETVNALNLLEFSESEQFDMFKILAAILHLGNIKIYESSVKDENGMDQERCLIETTDPSVKIVSELLDIDETEMIQWLCTRKIISMRQVFLKPMTVEEAITSRDALAKNIYSELFNWIVLMINRTLESEEPKYRFVGVLDIYGFETFETNSMEQLCINYANEKLQQQFNLHVKKLKQEEYIVEGIEWKMIDFYDNQLCIDLIEAKLGVLDLLDEECKLPGGSDAAWVEKLYSKCSKNPHFSKARFGTSSFTIEHSAGRVQYESGGFLEKNRDTILKEQMDVIRGSKNQLVRKLFQTETQKLASPRTKQTVCSRLTECKEETAETAVAGQRYYLRKKKKNVPHLTGKQDAAAAVPGPSGDLLREKLRERPVRTHGFQCELCEAHFSSDNNLSNHFTAYHCGEKQYYCEKCYKSYATQRRFKEHLKTHE